MRKKLEHSIEEILSGLYQDVSYAYKKYNKVTRPMQTIYETIVRQKRKEIAKLERALRIARYKDIFKGGFK